MVALGLLLLLLIPVSMVYCSAYLIELISTWKYTTVGAKIKQALVSIISGIILVATLYILYNY